jgi:hypothetical protein
MTTMNESTPSYPEASQGKETIYFCEQHGPMNKMTDLKEKADQISKKA